MSKNERPYSYTRLSSGLVLHGYCHPTPNGFAKVEGGRGIMQIKGIIYETRQRP